jgi:ABC-type Mn2+/Zn2+ transport system ATPase subunit
MLTIFAGLPGTGKSTLDRKIANILSPAERIVEIPVARGWTSQKDIIGFVNPLTPPFLRSCPFSLLT